MRFVIVYLISTFVVTTLDAQWAASASFLVGSPQGKFSDNVGRNGYGGEFTGAYAPEDIPLRLGITLGVMSYGSDERREPFSTTIPDVTVLVETTNNIVLINAEGRLQPNRGFIRPYLAMTIGVTLFDTRTTIRNTSTNEEIASSSNSDDAAFNYGFGGGIDLRLWTNTGWETETGERVPIEDVALHIGGTYLRGGEAEYLKEGSIRNVNGKVVYDLLRSRTDMVLYSIGVSLTF